MTTKKSPTLGRRIVSTPMAAAGGLQVPNVPVYVPPSVPVAPQPPPVLDGAGGKLEVYDRTLDLPVSTEVNVASTGQPWRAIDVYVQVTTPGWASVTPPNQWITISIYALVRGTATLVSVGRYTNVGVSSAITQLVARRVATARAPLAEGYLVTAHVGGTVALTAVQARIQVIATNEPGESDDDEKLLGTFPYRASGGAAAGLVWQGVDGVGWNAAQRFQGLELLAFGGFNTNAAVRYLQVHVGGIAAGVVPPGNGAAWSMPLVQNQSRWFGPDEVRNIIGVSTAGRLLNVALVGSTSPMSYVAPAAGDVYVQGLVR